MAVKKAVNVPTKDIGSIDVTGFAGGLYLQGEQNAKGNQIVEGENVRLTIDGFMMPRQSLQKWLPDTIGDVYEIFPAIWEEEIYNFTADPIKAYTTVATNFSTNPSLETDLAGYTVYNSANLIRDIVEHYSGAASMKVTTTGLGYALNFDGADDYVNVPDSTTIRNSTGDMTIAAWIKPDSLPSAHNIVSKDSDGGTRAWTFRCKGTVLEFEPDGVSIVTSSASTLSTGAWQHVAITMTNAGTRTYKFYVNGVLKETLTGYNAFTTAETNALAIGRRNYVGAEEYFDGTIDDVRMFDRVLSDSEISTLHSNHTDAGTNRMVRFRFDEGSGTSTTDSINSNVGTINGGATWVEGNVPTNSAFQGAYRSVNNLTSGNTYTYSFYVKGTAGDTVRCYVSDGVSDTYDSIILDGTWQRITHTKTLSSTNSTLYHMVEEANTATRIVYIDAVQVEEATASTDYFDGDTADTDSYAYSWTGTAHASTSIKQAISASTTDGKIRYCIEGDADWTDCVGDNTILMPVGARIRLLRILDVLLILGGDGGNKLAYVDLATKAVVKYTFVADPLSAPTATATGITASGSYKIYYGFTFTSASGETKLSPILTQDISKTRDQWKTDGSEFLTITRPSGNPAGSKYWNLYIALAANGGIIQDSDMLMLASGLDLNTTSIVDNGSLAIDVGRGNPPEENSTDGARVRQGIETNGRPVLFDDIDERHNVHIGGDGEYALDFSSSNGGYRSQPSKGTNYYPASLIGFRNGQGVPSLTILFSNTQGLSKQATLEQQTVNYGNQSFVVWAVTEQNYGAAGVASGYGVINYKGQLSFPSTDGFMSMDTQPQLQNVLATKGIDKDIKKYTERIKVSALNKVVGTAWNDRLLWIIPAYGFDEPNEILVRDLNNNGAWYTLKIPANWIGTVSPPSSPAFVYICQDNHIYKLFNAFGTVDYKTGAAETFATYAKGAMIGINDARNAYQALVQAMFYLVDMIGDVRIGVNYRDQNGNIKTKSKLHKAPAYMLSASGGWSDPQNVYESMAAPAGWDESFQIDETASTLERQTKRVPLNINDLASEVQWWVQTEPGYNDWMLRVVSYEGENLGIKPDLR